MHPCTHTPTHAAHAHLHAHTQSHSNSVRFYRCDKQCRRVIKRYVLVEQAQPILARAQGLIHVQFSVLSPALSLSMPSSASMAVSTYGSHQQSHVGWGFHTHAWQGYAKSAVKCRPRLRHFIAQGSLHFTSSLSAPDPGLGLHAEPRWISPCPGSERAD